MWPHVITCDCYGTLVQWPETLCACFYRLLPEGSDIGALHHTFTDIHARLRAAAYRPYTQLLLKMGALTFGGGSMRSVTPRGLDRGRRMA